MAAKFGNTWWGEAWLNALSNIDYENRIPRGATYARKGAVSSLKIKDNIVEAKVQGSRRTPYKVMMVLPKFQQTEIDRLVDHLLMKPALITELLQRKLSPQVAQIAQECGCKLFPTQWSDLKMNCNCPDWAVPCKHLASVVYMLSREIDNNPFIIFDIHGIHLLEELKNRGVNLECQAIQSQPMLAKSLLVKARSKKEAETDNTSAKPIDFSSLQSLSDTNALLLPDAPPFYVNGDFKQIYLNEFNRMVSAVQRFLNGKLLPEALFPTDDPKPHISTDSKVTFTITDNLEWTARLTEFDTTEPVSLNPLFQAALAINQSFVRDYDPTISTLSKSVWAAIHLISNSLIKPEILRLPDGTHTVIWLPLPSDATVCGIISALNAEMPAGMVEILGKVAKKAIPLTKPAELLVSQIITTISRAITLVKDDNRISRMFFRGEGYAFNGIGEKEIPGSIRVWCDSLIISQELWSPVIYVADKDTELQRFSLTISITQQTSDKRTEIPLSEILNLGEWERRRFEIIENVLRLANVIPDLNTYINNGARQPIIFDDSVFVDFVTRIIPSMRMLGLKVYMPKSLSTLLRPKAKLSIMDKEIESGMFSIFDFFTYNWRVAIGDEAMDMKEFEALVKNAEGLIRFKKSYIYVSPEDMMKLRAKLASRADLSPAELFQAALSEEYESVPVELSDGVRKKMEEFRTSAETPVPSSLKATLRPYQERGFSWLYRNMKIGFGSILADDMGLGKTLQTIALILKLKEENVLEKEKALVVAPVGLLCNWEAEIRRFAPTLRTHIYHGTTRDLKNAKDVDVVLTSYGIVRSDAAKFKKGKWRMVVIDEAQNIKNHKTAQSKAVVSLDAGYKVALSGTPVENRLSEYWSIMQFVNKGYLGSLKDFSDNFVKPIQVFNDVQCADRLKKITSPFLMRRMKTDKSIISDLPDKVERDVYTTLTPEQAALYEQTLNEAMAIIEGMPTNTKQALFKRQGIILQMILALKQICDHPALFLKNENTAAEISGKAQLLLDRVQEIVDANDKVLIFTQYREMGKILQDMIYRHIGQKPLFYHGGCSVKERSEMVDRFQNSRGNRIFILSLKAAGTGLNLTAATNFIHYDLWWNPAVEAQATDRAYRIGQKRNVMVDRFITTGTFEERINEMINSKRHLADMTVATGETWIGNLSNKELHEIFDR